MQADGTRMLFWIGYVTEQALVVNVRGSGLVLISGCGHPRIEQVLGVTERVLDIPIRAVVGGLVILAQHGTPSGAEFPRRLNPFVSCGGC